jgi:hypothetical protein
VEIDMQGQIKQGIVIEEGKVRAALRHRSLVAGDLKRWMIMIPLLTKTWQPE